MSQTDLFAAAHRPAVAPAPEVPDPEVIRIRLNALLELARTASSMPWVPQRVRVQEHLFSNMTRWLPEAEGERLHDAFAAELERLRGLLVAD